MLSYLVEVRLRGKPDTLLFKDEDKEEAYKGRSSPVAAVVDTR